MGLASFLFGQSEEEKLQEAATDARLKALDQKYEKGGTIYNLISEREGAYAADNVLNIVHQDEARDAQDTATGDQQIDNAFDSELSRRTSLVRDAAGSSINAVFKSVFGLVPWQVWLASAAFAFFYFGGWKILRKALGK